MLVGRLKRLSAGVVGLILGVLFVLATAGPAAAQIKPTLTDADTNQAAIQAWLRGGGGNAGSAFTTSFADPIGTTLVRGASGSASASTVRVVVRPDASMPGGFRILTAFPE